MRNWIKKLSHQAWNMSCNDLVPADLKAEDQDTEPSPSLYKVGFGEVTTGNYSGPILDGLSTQP